MKKLILSMALLGFCFASSPASAYQTYCQGKGHGAGGCSDVFTGGGYCHSSSSSPTGYTCKEDKPVEAKTSKLKKNGTAVKAKRLNETKTKKIIGKIKRNNRIRDRVLNQIKRHQKYIHQLKIRLRTIKSENKKLRNKLLRRRVRRMRR